MPRQRAPPSQANHKQAASVALRLRFAQGERSRAVATLRAHRPSRSICTPKDPTIRAKFDTYRFADHKHTVIDLLARVTRVSVETQRIVEAMRAAPR